MNHVALSHFSAFSWQFTAFRSIYLFFINIAEFTYFALSSSFSSISMTYNKQSSKFECVHQVGNQSYVAGCMDKYNMILVIPSDSRCTLTAPSMIWMPSLTHILLVNFVFNLIADSHLPVRVMTRSCWSIVNQLLLVSSIFVWHIRPLHMHRGIIMSHNLVTEIKKLPTHRKIDLRITFCRDM
jgi:hypothetical protein